MPTLTKTILALTNLPEMFFLKSNLTTNVLEQFNLINLQSTLSSANQA
jgi:hypothetical protein